MLLDVQCAVHAQPRVTFIGDLVLAFNYRVLPECDLIGDLAPRPLAHL